MRVFIGDILGFAAMTGMHRDHVQHVKTIADATRLVLAHAEALSTGAVKSKMDLRFYGKERSWGDFYGEPRPDIAGVNYTLNQTRLDEWKLGPFAAEPVIGVNAGNCSALETAYLNHCTC